MDAKAKARRRREAQRPHDPVYESRGLWLWLDVLLEAVATVIAWPLRWLMRHWF